MAGHEGDQSDLYPVFPALVTEVKSEAADERVFDPALYPFGSQQRIRCESLTSIHGRTSPSPDGRRSRPQEVPDEGVGLKVGVADPANGRAKKIVGRHQDLGFGFGAILSLWFSISPHISSPSRFSNRMAPARSRASRSFSSVRGT